MSEKTGPSAERPLIRVIASHQGLHPGAHVGIAEAIERWAQEHLEPLLAPHIHEGRLLAGVKQHAKGEAKYSVTLRMQLPRKHVLVAHGVSGDLPAALAQAEERLLREAKAYKDRLHHQTDYRRKARRARLRRLKARREELPLDIAGEARDAIEPLLQRLEQAVRREYAFLRNSGELPGDYPSVEDVVDEAVLVVSCDWQPGLSSDELFQRLLRAAFQALDYAVEASRQYGALQSLDEPPAADADDQAEDMVEEEFYEFYQPDEALHLADILPDITTTPAEDDQALAERDFALRALSDLPAPWRRAFTLAEFERLSAQDIAAVVEAEIASVEKQLEQAQAFIEERLKRAGIALPFSRLLGN